MQVIENQTTFIPNNFTGEFNSESDNGLIWNNWFDTTTTYRPPSKNRVFISFPNTFNEPNVRESVLTLGEFLGKKKVPNFLLDLTTEYPLEIQDSFIQRWIDNLNELNISQLFEPKPKEISTSKAILQIRLKAALKWEEIANLFDVSQQTIKKWVRGGFISPKNANAVKQTWEIICQLDQGTRAKTRAKLFLNDNKSGISRFELLKQGKYEAVLETIEPIPGLNRNLTPLDDSAKDLFRPQPQMLLIGANPDSYELGDSKNASLPEFVVEKTD